MTKSTSRRPLFEGSKTEEMWVEGQSQFSDSKILLTVSNHSGDRTVLITPQEIVTSNPKMFVQAPPERIVTPAQLRQQKINNAVKYVGYMLSAVLITFSVLSAAGFVKARIVLTGSMEPAIKPGDIVILAPTPRTQPKIGDVVAYTGRRFSGESVGTFTHRIIGGNPEEGFLVKGDANPSPDVQRPTPADISGVVFFVIPFIGKLLTPKMLMILVPIGIGLWLVIDTLRSDG
jgi:signal peptidase I